MANYMTTSSLGTPTVKVSPSAKLAVGSRLKILGTEAFIQRVHANEIVDLVHAVTLTEVKLRDPETGAETPVTLDALRELHRQGILHFVGEPETAAERQGRHAFLDPESCEEIDPRSPWRQSLARRAKADRIKRTDREARIWLDDNYGREPGDLRFPKPSPSALRRWIAKIIKEGDSTATLVSGSGRRKGCSPLDPLVNALVHEAALYFWTRPNATKVKAHAWLEEQIKLLNARREGGRDDYACPSKQTVYTRIDALRCRDTVATKHGPKEAARLFEGSGEPIAATQLLEIVLMDATTLEQYVVFDDDWQLPACKVRIVALMEAVSHAIIGHHVYAGPNRGEASIEAVIASLSAPEIDPEALAETPTLAWMFGRGRSYLPDNEKALIADSTIDSFNEIGSDVLMPPIEMPTAKAALERFFRFLKEALADIPGTVIDPRRATELGYDAMGAALTLSDIRRVVASVIEEHNSGPSKGLQGQSPALVWERMSHTRVTPVFENVDHVRRVLGRSAMVLLTRDGIEHNGIRYRDAALVTRLVDNLAHTQKPRGRRKDGSLTFEVKIRVSPGNLDSIQVWDAVDADWITLPSTQPDYTHKLSEWEHREYVKQAKRRNEPFASEKQRLSSKSRTLRLIDELAPKLPLQQRSGMATLYQSEQVRKLAAKPFALPARLEGITPAAQVTAEAERNDLGAPTGTPAAPRKPTRRETPPPRAADYGGAVVSGKIRKIDWEGVSLGNDNDGDAGDDRHPFADDQQGEAA